MNQVSTEILFDKFEVIGCLKKDSHTSVYLANHIYLGKKIILKTLDTNDLSDKTILERFKREAQILARLDHPNLIKVLDFGNYSHYFYISFEYFESRNLRELLKQNSITIEEKNQLVIQLLKALNAAHQNHVIHRDIKPENILVNSNNELKIADFGLALIQNDHALTQKSSIVGTPSYMSPEQIHGETLTPQSDLFSTGIVCYELYTGLNPVLGKDLSETINRILNFDESKLNDLNKLPEQPKNIVRSMLRKNLAVRLKSASDGLQIFGINATIYDLANEIKNKQKKNHILFYLVPLITAALVIIWLFNVQYDLPDSTPVSNYSPDSAAAQDNNMENSLINVADETPKELEKVETTEPVSLVPASLNVEVAQWAKVYVDNHYYGETPLRQTIQLPAGRHTIRLEHTYFPTYTQVINLKPGATRNVKINFENIVGYVDFRIEPWGRIFINNADMGETSGLAKPIPLLPGRYRIRVENSAFGKYEKSIRVSAEKTSLIEVNLKSLK